MGSGHVCGTAVSKGRRKKNESERFFREFELDFVLLNDNSAPLTTED